MQFSSVNNCFGVGGGVCYCVLMEKSFVARCCCLERCELGNFGVIKKDAKSEHTYSRCTRRFCGEVRWTGNILL